MAKRTGTRSTRTRWDYELDEQGLRQVDDKWQHPRLGDQTATQACRPLHARDVAPHSGTQPETDTWKSVPDRDNCGTDKDLTSLFAAGLDQNSVGSQNIRHHGDGSSLLIGIGLAGGFHERVRAVISTSRG